MVADIIESQRVNRVYGVVSGIVVNNKDPEGRYRVKVKFPQFMETDDRYTDEPDDEDFVSAWARIATSMAGIMKEGSPDVRRGSFFLPEVDDEVLCIFEHGDIRYPYIIGMLFNAVDEPIHDNLSQDGKNNYRSIKSRSGHMLTFYDNDEEGKESIIIQTKVQNGDEDKMPDERDGHWIRIDHSDGEEKIEIYDRKQENYILIDSTNDKITIEAKTGDIDIKAKCKVYVECETLETLSKKDTTIEAQGKMLLKAGKGMEIKGGPSIKQQADRIDLN